MSLLTTFPNEIFAAAPVVYAVGDEYKIFVIPNKKTVMGCRIGDNEYYDDSNGVLRSETLLHQITVPAAELDKAGEYTIFYREFQERVPYYNQVISEGEVTCKFRKVNSSAPRFYLLSDVHTRLEAGVKAAKSFKEMDFLVVNGDVHDNSETAERLLLAHRVAAEITNGEIPVVYSRGNHDLRGAWAERQAEFTPTANGNSFYTFRLGSIWGIVLDCGEDKPDESREYGGVNCCHAFRQRETAFLKKIIANAEKEYNAPGVEYRLVISHINFSEPHKEPFNIEYDLYGQWCDLIRQNIRPTAYFYGHVHQNYVTLPGSEKDIFNQGAPAVVAGVPDRSTPEATGFTGAGISLSSGKFDVAFINDKGETVDSVTVPVK
jgi:hypothetical protein